MGDVTDIICMLLPQIEMPLSAAYPAGGRVMADNLWYKDAQEGIAAFKEKRKPVVGHTQDKVEG